MRMSFRKSVCSVVQSNVQIWTNRLRNSLQGFRGAAEEDFSLSLLRKDSLEGFFLTTCHRVASTSELCLSQWTAV